MYTIHLYCKNRYEFKDMETAWGANMIAWKYVSSWGWEEARVVDNSTGEILKIYKK